MGDDLIAARNFSYDVKEYVTSDLQDQKFEFDKVVTANINAFPDTFNAKAILFYPELN